MKNSRMYARLLSLALALLLPVMVHAAEIVGKITVIDVAGIGDKGAIEQMVASTIGTKVGHPFSPVQLSKDVAALIKMSGVADVQCPPAALLPDGRRHIIFLLRLKQNIVSKSCQGNTHYSNRYILDLTKSAIGQPPNEITMAADRKAIVDKYEQEGYTGTEVTIEQKSSLDGKGIDLIYVIKETQRYSLKGVAFKGNTAFTHSELADVLATKRPWWRYIIRFGNHYNERLRPLDIDNIIQLYATKGYLDCQVSKVELVPLEGEPEWVTPTYYIQEGVQYKFGKRSFSGNKRFTVEQLTARCKLKAGDVYTSTQANEDLEEMKGLYAPLGYLELSFYPNFKKDAKKAVVDLDYSVKEGDTSRIGRIIISGNEVTRDRVIRRELTIFEDDLADTRKIEQSKRRLENLGYFESVNIVPKRSASPQQRDLDVHVTEKPTGSISVGAGFSTEDSIMGFLEISETNFSIGRMLKLEKPKGDGQRMRTHIGIGSKTSSINISLTEPSLFDSQFELTGELFYNTRYEDEYDEKCYGFGTYLSWPVAFTLPFMGDHIEYWRVSTGIRIEQFDISHLDDDEKESEVRKHREDGNWRYPKGRNTFIYEDKGSEWANRFTLNLSRDTRNRPFFANRGSRVTLGLEYITKALGSYADYMKFHADAEKFLPVYEDLFLRLSVNGASISHFSGDDVKIFDRYFAGGYGTVRGFKRHDISPVNKNKNSIGGSTMVCSTIEFIKPVKDMFFLKAFCDAGGVWWNEFNANMNDLNASIGVGIQFKKLPVRLDYGYPIVTGSDHLDGHSGRLHFSIDYAF